MLFLAALYENELTHVQNWKPVIHPVGKSRLHLPEFIVQMQFNTNGAAVCSHATEEPLFCVLCKLATKIPTTEGLGPGSLYYTL